MSGGRPRPMDRIGWQVQWRCFLPTLQGTSTRRRGTFEKAESLDGHREELEKAPCRQSLDQAIQPDVEALTTFLREIRLA